jgi:two-component system, cell cycle sensor histidine kinase and response regulator CckA
MDAYSHVLGFFHRIGCWSGVLSPSAIVPRTVLIVDDEGSIRNLVRRVLDEAGYLTAVASDGAEALVLAATLNRVDLLVTDLMMPNMSGDELARRMRVSEPDLPVLYLTGFSDRLFAERLQLWENEAFLDKPCSGRGLVEAVALIMHRPLQASVTQAD